MEKNSQKGTQKRIRNPSLDLVRVVAVFSVLSIHFFYNNEFYFQPVEGGWMFAAVLLRAACTPCVPLFIVLTGALMNKKVLSREYYKGINKTLYIYLMTAILSILFRIFYQKQQITALDALKSIFDYSAAGYSWYIEMYIGVFLLIPFLNVLWEGLGDQRKRKALVLTLTFLTALPSIISDHFPLFPDYWEYIYPLTYYFIGCYLSEYKVGLSRIINIAALASAILLFGLYTYWISYGEVYVWGYYQNWNAIGVMAMTILLFILLSSLDLSGISDRGKWILMKLSDLSLGIYLCSWITDSLIYPVLNSSISVVVDRFIYYIFAVPLSFCGAAILSFILNTVYDGVIKMGKSITRL